MSEATSLPVYIQISEMLMREIIAGRLSDGEQKCRAVLLKSYMYPFFFSPKKFELVEYQS